MNVQRTRSLPERLWRRVRRRAARWTRPLQERVDAWQEGLDAYRHEIDRCPPRMEMVGRLSLFRDFPAWKRWRSSSAFDESSPWVTFEAARLLRSAVGSGSRVLEFGSGGSTVYFARRGAEVVAIEHKRGWFERVQEAVAGYPGVTLILAEARPPRDAAEAAIGSGDPSFSGLTFADYVGAAERYPDHAFDLLIVDGRARPSTFFRAEPKVRIGGRILLDDSERERYGDVMHAAAAAGWPERGRYGPKPFSPRFARTTIWTKTRDLDPGAGDRGGTDVASRSTAPTH